MTAPRIARRYDGAVVLTFPYSGDLVAALKAHVPAHARTYDPDTRAWTIAAAYAGLACQLMRAAFPDVLEEGAGATFDRGGDPRESALVILHLRPSAPPELVDAAYRCLARLHHPDRGGDTAVMQAINAAAEQLRSAS